jgi:hypothetical protein
MEHAMTLLAQKFMKIKFLKIRSSSAVENWPESNLPTIFAYHDGELQHQLFTLKSIGGSSMTSDGQSLSFSLCLTNPWIIDFEWWLVERDIVDDSDLTEDPREGRSTSSIKTNLILQSTTKQSTHYYSDEDI